MKFEHLIEINDPLNPLIEALTRRQIWLGLVMRAEAPRLFVAHLDECILEPGDAVLHRRLRYGDLVLRDAVSFIPEQAVVYQIAAQQEMPASHLMMSIEEPRPDGFFVRFQYDDGNDEATDAANAMYNDFRRSAYVESDIDTVRMIRELAAQGRLGAE